MSTFTRENFPGYTRPAGQTMLGSMRPTTDRKTSKKKVTFETPGPSKIKTTRRRSKSPRSPRAKIIRYVSKGIRRISPSKFKNKYAKDFIEFMKAMEPILGGLLALYLYGWITNKITKDETTSSTS